MQHHRILKEQTCQSLEPGYYFFDDVESLDFLSFDNLRSVAWDEGMDLLKESVADQGIKVPIQVAYDTFKERCQVLSGERRSRVVDLLRNEGKDDIRLPCLVLVGDSRIREQNVDFTVTAIVSNLHSQPMTQVEKMRCYQALYQKGLSKIQIARCCGKDRKTIERSLQLAGFEEDVLDFIEEKEKQGLLRSRSVEVIGQQLNKSIEQAKMSAARDQLENSAKVEGDSNPIEISNDKIKEIAKEVQLSQDQEKQIRDAAFKVLKEQVKRREVQKSPRDDATKLNLKRTRALIRKVQIDVLEENLLLEFKAKDVMRIIEIINQLHEQAKSATITQVVCEDFSTLKSNDSEQVIH